jgi:hypothetical protein
MVTMSYIIYIIRIRVMPSLGHDDFDECGWTHGLFMN